MRGNPNENSKLFTASGTFVAPFGFGTQFYVTALGGGGGGGGGNTSTGVKGGGGGSGDAIWRQTVTVVPGNSYTVTVGGGGGGGAAGNPGIDGSAGGATSFGALVSMSGGGGGLANGNGGSAGGPGGSAGGSPLQSVFGLIGGAGGSPGLNLGPSSKPPQTSCWFWILAGSLLVARYFGWFEHQSGLLLPFLPFAGVQTSPFGAGGAGGTKTHAGFDGGAGLLLVEWGSH